MYFFIIQTSSGIFLASWLLAFKRYGAPNVSLTTIFECFPQITRRKRSVPKLGSDIQAALAYLWLSWIYGSPTYWKWNSLQFSCSFQERSKKISYLLSILLDRVKTFWTFSKQNGLFWQMKRSILEGAKQENRSLLGLWSWTRPHLIERMHFQLSTVSVISTMQSFATATVVSSERRAVLF